MTMAAGIGALTDEAYFRASLARIAATRAKTTEGLISLGFEVLDSSTNFVFARHKTVGGRELYLSLKEKGILIRHFDKPRLHDFNRITIGSEAEMEQFLAILTELLEETT